VAILTKKPVHVNVMGCLFISKINFFNSILFKGYPSYTGDLCEFGNCKNQPVSCLTDFGTAKCNDAQIVTILKTMIN
jgi:hypothetical protein